MKTYDQNGRLLGSNAADSLTPIDVTAQYLPYYDPNAPAGSQVLAPVTVTASPPVASASWLDSLLNPPALYWLIAGVALAAYVANDKRK